MGCVTGKSWSKGTSRRPSSSGPTVPWTTCKYYKYYTLTTNTIYSTLEYLQLLELLCSCYKYYVYSTQDNLL